MLTMRRVLGNADSSVCKSGKDYYSWNVMYDEHCFPSEYSALVYRFVGFIV